MTGEGETRSPDGFELDYGLPAVSLDARATARITRVAAATVNVWVARGIFPGVTIGPQGRARAFSANLVYHIAVVAALVRLGLAAPQASVAAIDAHRQGGAGPGRWLVIGPAELGSLGSPVGRPVHVITVTAEIDKVLPGVEGFMIIDIGTIWTRVLAAVEAANAEAEG